MLFQDGEHTQCSCVVTNHTSAGGITSVASEVTALQPAGDNFVCAPSCFNAKKTGFA